MRTDGSLPHCKESPVRMDMSISEAKNTIAPPQVKVPRYHTSVCLALPSTYITPYLCPGWEQSQENLGHFQGGFVHPAGVFGVGIHSMQLGVRISLRTDQKLRRSEIKMENL